MELVPNERQAALVAGVRAGDRDAERELAVLFQDRIRVMLTFRTRDAETARDLTQDVLLATLNALRSGQLREPTRLAAFVHGIARNMASQHVRLRAQRPDPVPLDPNLHAATTADEGERRDRHDLARRALRVLTPADRRILLLTLVEGLKAGEIASRLGLPAEVVRTRKSRAVRRVSDEVRRLSRTPPASHYEQGRPT